ncbi:MAG TPA: protein phosphatase 2C domain-containing protein [Anaerolineales bacterium]|nr:protein phosphatase 2C domain-containing protein [Anaerolineales bacterium]
MSEFIHKLFGRHPEPEPGPEAPPAQEASQPTGEEFVPPHLEPPQILVGVGHSVGRLREHNEDSLFTLTTNLVIDAQTIPFGVYIVADGMGGHLHGERASGVAVRVMAGYLIENLYLPLFGHPAGQPDRDLQDILRLGVEKAHQAILAQAPGGGTTLTTVVVWNEQVSIVHVGDSRAYAVDHQGGIAPLTRDHSLVSRLVEMGQISSDEAAAHPQRNVLYRALGQGEPVDAEYSSLPLSQASHLLLCSDGLWGTISEADLSRLIGSSNLPAEVCQKLVEAANLAGGPDNISVILVRLPD